MNGASPAGEGRRIEDVGVVGAGIVGLAHAWSAARRGHRVTVFERSRRRLGCIDPQLRDDLADRSARGRSTHARPAQPAAWLELAREAGLWVNPCGSIHLAHRQDEWAVLEEFASVASKFGYTVELLNRESVLHRTAAANPDGLLGGLFSPTELAVNPRTAVRALPGWLASRLDVRFEFGTTITHVEPGRVRSASGRARGPSTARSSAAGPISRRSFQKYFVIPASRAASSRC